MRYLTTFGFCVIAAACSNAPTAPTASLGPLRAGNALIDATAGSELPLKGLLQATEAVSGSQHHLAGAGNGTHLGAFSYTADIIVDEATGDGSGTAVWTAANGDQIRANTTGRITSFDFPIIGIEETQTITDGTGRFVKASGTVILERSLNLDNGNTAGSFSGTLSLGQ